mgnify:CR=1 FL=1
MRVDKPIRGRIGNALYEHSPLPGSATGAVIEHLLSHDPALNLHRARHCKGESRSFERINRNGVVYYTKSSYTFLNRNLSSGTGMQFVKGSKADPTGVFFTEQPEATDEEEIEAVKAYLFAVGIPRRPLLVISALVFPACIEKTPENKESIVAAGGIYFG